MEVVSVADNVVWPPLVTLAQLTDMCLALYIGHLCIFTWRLSLAAGACSFLTGQPTVLGSWCPDWKKNPQTMKDRMWWIKNPTFLFFLGHFEESSAVSQRAPCRTEPQVTLPVLLINTLCWLPLFPGSLSQPPNPCHSQDYFPHESCVSSLLCQCEVHYSPLLRVERQLRWGAVRPDKTPK